VFLETAANGRVISTHKKKQIIFAQGDAADSVFYIKAGKVKITVVSKQGKEAVVAILGADQFLGEGCLIGQPKRLATAMAVTECVTMRVEKAEIVRVLHEEPAFSQMFVSHILERSARVEEDLVDQLFNSTEKRLARVLLLMANFGKEGRPEAIIAKISQETLADMIGTTRSRVSHFMNKFRQLGFIDYNGRLEVHSSLLSRRSDISASGRAASLCLSVPPSTICAQMRSPREPRRKHRKRGADRCDPLFFAM
jgi:CRP-like cAMP-binding protein